MVRRQRFGAWAPLLALLCVGAVVALAQTLIPLDRERYWLAFAGSWNLAHGHILESLRGSWYPDRSWANQEWLVALLTAWTREHGLYIVMELLFGGSLIFGLGFAVSETIRTRTHPLVASVQIGVTGLAVVFFAQDRAQTFVWVLLPALILTWRRRPWVAVPILALWANLHASFPIGVLWMLLHLDRRRALPFAAATLATLANPLGWHLWAFVIGAAHGSRLAGYVNEWVPALRSHTGFLLVLLALAPLWLRLAGGLRLRRPIRIGDLVWTTLLVLATIVATRYVMLLFLTTATSLGTAFRMRAKPMPFAANAAAVFFCLMIAGLAARSLLAAPVIADPAFATLERGVDFAACAPIVNGKSVFVDASESGSVVEFYGGHVNLDGRVDAFPAKALRDSHAVLIGAPGAAALVERAQLLALVGRFTPPRPWYAKRRCGSVRLYARTR